MISKSQAALGCGAGLRSPHYPVITSEWPRISWFEAISENYMDTGGRPLHILEEVRRRYPIALHGTALSIGSMDPVNHKYLERLKRLIDRIDPFIVSDHLCWSSVKGDALHDLLPLPFTEEALSHIVSHVGEVQNFLKRKILLENVSTYVTYRHSTIPEWEFLSEVARRSGCGILLDVNNLYVNSVNHRFNPRDYLKNIPAELVGQIHLGGHTDMGSFLFDTHSKPVIDPVWKLYEEALGLLGPVPTLIEWDADIPPFERLVEEVRRAEGIYGKSQVTSHQSPVETQKKNSEKPSASNGPVLLEVQDWMRVQVQPSEDTKPDPITSQNFLLPTDESFGDRLSAYTGGYPARIHESLAETYETIHQLLGHDEFWNLCNAYGCRYHSHDYNLNYGGRYLSEFLKKSDFQKKFPLLPDLADFEWRISQAFHAFEETPFNAVQLSRIPLEEWENARLVFQPSVSLFSSSWPVLNLWQNRRGALDPRLLKRLEAPENVLIARRGLQIRCEVLDENQSQLLGALLKGQSLGEACEVLTEGNEEASPPIAEWFSRWVADGLIARCEIQRNPAIVP